MKATVLEVFQDKTTKEHYTIGQVIDKDASRIAELSRLGLVRSESKFEDKIEEEEAEYVAEPLKRSSKKKR